MSWIVQVSRICWKGTGTYLTVIKSSEECIFNHYNILFDKKSRIKYHFIVIRLLQQTTIILSDKLLAELHLPPKTSSNNALDLTYLTCEVAYYSQSRALSHQSSTNNKNIVSSAFQYPNAYVGHKLFLCLLFHSPNQACLTFLSFLSKIWG